MKRLSTWLNIGPFREHCEITESIIDFQRSNSNILLRYEAPTEKRSSKVLTLTWEDVFRKPDWSERGINVNGLYLSHLCYADDTIIMAKDPTELKRT